MNNLKYYNDSMAYDFQLFMPKEKPQEKNDDNIIKMPKTVKKPKRKAKAASKRVSESMFAIVATVILVGTLCANLCLRIKVNELNNDINTAKTVLSEKQSEYVDLAMEYENRISFINLEAAATELGMKKLDRDQVVYIRVNNKNTARNADGEVMVANE